MRLLICLVLCLPILTFAQADAYRTHFEKGNGNQSAEYSEAIEYFKLLANDFETIGIREMGPTDSGIPLHVVIYNPDKQFIFPEASANKAVILINNAIHAGEPDGIDATMMFFRDLALGKISIPKNTIVAAIPVYNIGGALQRGSSSRVNQEGPELYGFRGNARNYDLNRDFMKQDTRNTESFVEIYHTLNPEVFIDNHVSNGADYQYTLTYIMTQHNKLGNVLGKFINEEMTPAIVAQLKAKGQESTPYVNAWSHTPEKGFGQFFESPRFATGYTSLFNTLGYVVETHMLKKYSERVKATYQFMAVILEYTDKNYKKIKELRSANSKQYAPGMTYTIEWEVDSAKVGSIPFLGYEAGRKKSEATTGDRLFYDRSKPFKKVIPFYKEFKAKRTVVIPEAYIIPQGQWHIVDLLRNNGIDVQPIPYDANFTVEAYRIKDYKTSGSAYEGHYLHRNTVAAMQTETVNFRKGDYWVTMNQKGIKYILEALEPEAMDSFFNWNFFDSILQQKEGYSDYVFEDLAARLLLEDPDLRKSLELKKSGDSAFAKNAAEQLDWVYKHSKYYESAHMKYPVYRVPVVTD